MADIRVLLLGSPSIERDGATLKVARRKALALLAYLALAGESCRRETLAGLLWPDSSEAEAHAYLRNALWVLRATIGEEWIERGRESAGLAHRAGLWIDVVQFQTLIGSCAEHGHSPREVCPACLAPLAQAVELYRGDFLAGFTLSDSQPFDEWQLIKAESLRRDLAGALEQVVRCLSAQQEFERAIPYARRWLALDPLNEDAMRQMMRSYEWSGQTVAALRQYRESARLLNNELGLQPSPESTALYQAIKAKEAIPLPTFYKGVTPAIPAKLAFVARAAASTPTAAPKSARSSGFVGRDAEMRKLAAALDRTLSGVGQILFIKGEAGTGKTALAREFARTSQHSHEDLLVATGSSDPHTGQGDPYLPFREVLNLLAGDVESRGLEGSVSPENAARLQAFAPVALPVLLELGEDVMRAIGGARLQSQAGALASGMAEEREHPGPGTDPKDRPLPGSDWFRAQPSQARFFAEYASVIQGLARLRPLALILDDLQWADASSVSLLSHLCRRLLEDRVLIIGTFRPEDLAADASTVKNSLKGVVDELRGRLGDILIDLDEVEPLEAQRFVNAIVDREPNRLGQAFRQRLYEHTGGQPLFTIELLRHLQQDGSTVRRDDAGRWVEVQDPGWEGLPPRVEGIIEKRVGRLTPELRRMLLVASVEGEEFTAEVVAAVNGSSEREVIRRLSDELDREHRLVTAQGLSRLDGQRLSRFRFRHTLYHRYLYASISEAERTYLHEDVGNALERIYGDHAPSIAVQLARHFECAGEIEKTVKYLLQAGNRARELSANDEAIDHLRRALILLQSLPASDERTERELLALIHLGNALIAIRGYADPEVGRVYTRAHSLAAPLGRTPQIFPAVSGLLQFNRVRGELQVARELGADLLGQAEPGGDPGQLAEAHRSCGITDVYLGEPARAYEHFEECLTSYRGVDRPDHILLYGDDPGVNSMSYEGWVLWLLGKPDQAAERTRMALAEARELAGVSPFTLTQALVLAGVLHNFRRDYVAVAETADAAFDLAARHGFEFWYAAASIVQGRARARQGWKNWGCSQMERGLAAWRATGIEVAWHYGAGLLAETYLEMGEPARGLHVVGDGLVDLPRAGYWWAAELHRLKGELLLLAGAPEAEAETSLRQALEIARGQGARSLELRAATSLARLQREHGSSDEAARRLAEIYGQFTEGLDTPDLQDARAILNTLPPAPSR